ncbi:hypothetical protein [Rhizobium sp. Root482]|uniref:hypothetical protein n=1 Tax=Rhizobium sp. Root482 TaxID=1736543 RepID=UPI0007003897|nr:hypothetical protein [Rhizobium sp. Root482]KQY26678.1 hypothetical protein ASD31_00235 [Rhizobium sp. Root482]
MNWLLTSGLLAMVSFLLGWGMIRRERLFEFPFLVGVMTFSFIIPQVPGLAEDHFLADGAFNRTVAFSIACLFMCWLGWRKNAKPLRFMNVQFDEFRLLVAALMLSLCGAYFYFQLSRLPGDMTIAVQMTGAPVVYIFFGRFLSYGLAIAVLCMARRFTWMSFLIVCFDLVFYLDRIVVTGKRAEAVEMFAIFALAYYFYRGWLLRRAVVLAVVVLGTLLMNSMGDYRAITQANDAPVWNKVREIDVVGNAMTLLTQGGPEMRNAILRMDSTQSTLQFDFGAFHWNRLVFNYVPAQLFGEDFKQSFMLDVPMLDRGYDPILGTTETGMADAFASFWYFGTLKFLLLSYLVRRIWVTAKSGMFAGQITYILSIVPAMHAVSHQTDWVMVVWVHMAMFLVPALLIALVPARPERPQPRSLPRAVAI